MNQSRTPATNVPASGRLHVPSPHALRFGGTLAGLILVSLSVWRLWSSVDATSGRLLALGALILLGTEIWGPEVVHAGSEWTVAGYRGQLTDRRLWILSGAIGLSAGIDVVIFFAMPTSMFDYTLLGGWLLSMLLLLAALLPAPKRAWWSTRRCALSSTSWNSFWGRECTWFVLLLTLAAATRLLYPTLLYPVRGDEGYHRALAQFILNPPSPELFTLDFLDDSRVYYVPQRLFMAVFGDGLGPARLYAGLWGVATLPPAYLLFRELFGRRSAIIGGFVLAVLPLHVNYSRQNLPQVYGVTWTALSLYCLVRALKTGKVEWWIGVGLATGIAQYGHTDARFIPITIALVLVYELGRDPRGMWNQRGNIMSAALAGLLAYGPTFSYVIHHPAMWSARSSGLNIITSGWLAQQAQTVGVVNALADQVTHNALPIFTASPPADAFYPSGAILPPWAVPFAVAGVVRCAVRCGQRGPFFLLSWAGLTFVLGGILVTPQFGSQHLIELCVPISLFAALGIEWMVEFWPRRQTKAIIALTGIVVASGVYYFFVQYQPIPARADAPGYKDDTMTEAAYFMRNVRPDARVYFFDHPSMNYHWSPQAPWLSGDRTDVVDVIPEEKMPPIQLGKSGAVFLFLPSRSAYMTRIERQFPGGRKSALHTSYLPGHALALVYMVGHPLRFP